MTAPNPLVAPRQDSTTWDTGLGIVESIGDTVDGIRSGSWSEIALGGAGTALESLSLAIDPIGTLVSYGISWLIEHIKPLSDALDWLAGDPDTITSYAQTWRNVAGTVNTTTQSFSTAVTQQTAQWTGSAGDAYRAHASTQAEGLGAVATAASGVGDAVQIVGTLVGVVREIVRDLVAECIATLVVRIPQWLAEAGLTLGLATPHVVASAVALISKWVKRINDWIGKLVRSINNLRPLLRRLDETWQALRDIFGKLGRAGDGSPSPNSPGGTPTSPNAMNSPDTQVPTTGSNSGPTTPTTPQSTPGSVSPTPQVSPETGTPGPTTPQSTTPQSTTPGTTTPQSTTPGTTSPQSTTPGTTTPQSPGTSTPQTQTGGSGQPPPPDRPRMLGNNEPQRLPNDRSAAQTVERIPENRLTRDGNGLITHVDNRPVRDYLNEVMTNRADELRQLRESGDIARKDAGEVASVAIDRRTGEIVEGFNGRPNDVIPDDQLHPVLRQQLDEMRANGPYQQYNEDGTPMMRDGQPVRTEFPHGDNPLRHAEVKAVNDLLWKRGPDADASALNDFRVDNSFPFVGDGPRSAPCCPNCHRMLEGVPSNAGRFNHEKGHPDRQLIPE